MNTFGSRIIDFYSSLDTSLPLPVNVEIMNPYRHTTTLEITRIFYRKYFNDNKNRYFIFGINPGRYGGGVTGIPFTDPIRLKDDCGINHPFPLKPELSSQFIYMMIHAFGGPEKFYNKFFLTAVCPLGFTMHGKNANYYDSNSLLDATKQFILSTIKKQVASGAENEICFCLGQGKNLIQLTSINAELKLFKNIIVLPHPRWVLQYKRKSVNLFIDSYLKSFNSI